MAWDLEYYETENGKIPIYDFLEELPLKLRAKAFSDLELLESLGNQLPMIQGISRAAYLNCA